MQHPQLLLKQFLKIIFPSLRDLTFSFCLNFWLIRRECTGRQLTATPHTGHIVLPAPVFPSWLIICLTCKWVTEKTCVSQYFSFPSFNSCFTALNPFGKWWYPMIACGFMSPMLTAMWSKNLGLLPSLCAGQAKEQPVAGPRGSRLPWSTHGHHKQMVPGGSRGVLLGGWLTHYVSGTPFTDQSVEVWKSQKQQGCGHSASSPRSSQRTNTHPHTWSLMISTQWKVSGQCHDSHL